MKNLISLVEPGDIRDYVSGLWRSDAFRDSMASGGFVSQMVDRFAWLPRVFAQTSNDNLERAHFCTWWGVTMIRDGYENPIIHDLYYLHEFAHAASMPYFAGIGREAFDQKMQRNELEASVLSEIQVYLEMPGLREASFSHPIYADRFLDNPDLSALWRANHDVALETIRSMRKDVMVSKPEHQMDLTERWIRRFTEQNTAYSTVWSHRYGDVEAAMAKFQLLACRDRVEAANFHVNWLHGEMAGDPVDHIPFRQEAELFSPFYWSNKARYEAAIAAEKTIA